MRCIRSSGGRDNGMDTGFFGTASVSVKGSR